MEKSQVTKITPGDKVHVTLSGLDDVVQTNQGQYFFRNDSHYVIYEESIEGLEQPLKSKLKFRDGYLEMARTGAAQMTILLEPGKEHPVRYMTPTGAIDLTFEGKNVQVKHSENVIYVKAEYVMGQGEWRQDNCILDITIKRIS